MKLTNVQDPQKHIDTIGFAVESLHELRLSGCLSLIELRYVSETIERLLDIKLAAEHEVNT